jgi:hypothetical protein
MKALDMPTHPASGRPRGHEPVEYRWAVTLTRRSTDDRHSIFETYKVARTPDELCDIVLHSSLDPTIVAYSYHRYVQPDPPAIGEACGCCAEPFDSIPPSLRWRPVATGGEVLVTCRACGAYQISSLNHG